MSLHSSASKARDVAFVAFAIVFAAMCIPTVFILASRLIAGV